MPRTKIAPGVTTIPSKIIIDGDDWAELINPGTYPKYNVSRNSGVSCTRAFLISYDQLGSFGDEVLPLGLPGLHPDVPNCFVDECSVEPFGDGNVDWYQNDLGYTEAGLWIAIVNYKTFTFEVTTGQTTDNLNGGALYEGTIDVTNEVMNLPGHSFKWRDAGGTPEANKIPDATAFPAVIPITNISIEIPRVLVVPYSAINSAVGKINNATYMTHESESLLYMGASIKFQRAYSGAMQFGLTHRFKKRAIGWNMFWNVAASAWRKTDPYVYTSASFASLIPGVS